ncbi:Clathrin light chain [Coemansia erecta]|nr:Clathrin light chain [Coemansia sp. RSA 2618]KAJ2823895.1 Clathrin light chain [Coemansia erecta]
MADDPMEEFLARERAALGDDAEQFQSGASNSPAAVLSPSASEMAAAGDASPFMPVLNPGSPEFATPANANSPPVNAMSPVNATSPPISTTSPPTTTTTSGFEQEWQAKHRETIDARDEASRAKHEEIIAEARQAIDKFYEEYNERKDRAIEENRANQEIEVQAAMRGTVWERVVKQIDMATKAAATSDGEAKQRARPQGVDGQAARDTSRMRDLMQDLRRDPEAPGLKSKSKKAEAAAA